MTPTAEKLATRVCRMLAKARGTHDDKFMALVASIKALGVADAGPRTNLPGQRVSAVIQPNRSFDC